MQRRPSATPFLLAAVCRLIAAITLLIAISAVPTARVAACSCILMGDDSDAALEASDLAFSGTVVGEQPSVIPGGGREPPAPGPNTYLFKVDGVAKGEVGAVAGVMSGTGGGDCGMTFERDERWMVFANRETADAGDGPEPDERFWTSICSGNLPLEPDQHPPVPVTNPVSTQEPEAEGGVPVELVAAVLGAAAIALVSAYLFTRSERSA